MECLVTSIRAMTTFRHRERSAAIQCLGKLSEWNASSPQSAQ
jgi:hypothetical protein